MLSIVRTKALSYQLEYVGDNTILCPSQQSIANDKRRDPYIFWVSKNGLRFGSLVNGRTYIVSKDTQRDHGDLLVNHLLDSYVRPLSTVFDRVFVIDEYGKTTSELYGHLIADSNR